MSPMIEVARCVTAPQLGNATRKASEIPDHKRRSLQRRRVRRSNTLFLYHRTLHRRVSTFDIFVSSYDDYKLKSLDCIIPIDSSGRVTREKDEIFMRHSCRYD